MAEPVAGSPLYQEAQCLMAGVLPWGAACKSLSGAYQHATQKPSASGITLQTNHLCQDGGGG